MSGLEGFFKRAVDEFDRRVQQIDDEQWGAPTPCTEWDVRALVNHLVNEDKWVKPLFEGKTIAEVGDVFDGDLLGDNPKGSWNSASREATGVVSQDGLDDQTVHVSFGDISGREYIHQLLGDHLIHAWDLARGIGADESLDPELVHYVYDAMKPHEDGLRSSGVYGEKVDVPDDADEQTRLLALVGRKA